MDAPPTLPRPPDDQTAVWLDALPGAVVQVDASGTVRWANLGACHLLGSSTRPAVPLATWFGPTFSLPTEGRASAPQRMNNGRWVSLRRGPVLDGGCLLQIDGAPPGRDSADAQSQIELAAELAGLVLARLDRRTGRYHFNGEGLRLFGLSPDPDGIPAALIGTRMHPDDAPAARRAAEISLRERRPVDVDLRFADAEGRWRHLLMRGVVQFDASGQPVAELSVALDITARREAEAQARELTARLDLAARTAGIGYWSREGDSERAFWNDQMRALHGLAPDEPVPTLREWRTTFVHPDDQTLVRREFQQWLSGQTPSVQSELRVIRRDGQVRHLMTHSLLQNSGDAPVLFGIAIDVTDRRLADQALRRAHERAALAARGAGIGTWELDRRTGVAHWDEQMWRLRGMPAQPTVPTTAEMLELVHADDREVTRELMRAASTSDEVIEYQFRLCLPDGSVRWLASRSATVRDAQGTAERRIGVNWDVTDSRRAEAERRNREAAEQANQAKTRFLARMSHELRTPLNAVLGFTQLLQAREPDATASDWLGHVESAGQHLLSLINDVLDLASLDSGDLRVDLQAVDLSGLVDSTLPLLEPLCLETGLSVDRAPLEPMVLWTDPVRLRQVLLNLLGNALKYNRPGGRVGLTARREGGRAVLVVEDTGRGMSQTQLHELYEPFNRLGIEREGIQGTGIGLTIVKALVDRLGGTISVDSQRDVGTCFTLSLPLAADEASSTRDDRVPAVGRPALLAPLRGLLYIEDNLVNALIVQELLQRRPDIRLLQATDARSGLALAREARPALVLLDMQLPDDDGPAVLTALRADPATADTPVIMLSASALDDDRRRARAAGAADYWTKPIDADAFHRAIDGLFGPHSA